MLMDLIRQYLRKSYKLNLKKIRKEKVVVMMNCLKKWFRSEVYKSLQTIATFSKHEKRSQE